MLRRVCRGVARCPPVTASTAAAVSATLSNATFASIALSHSAATTGSSICAVKRSATGKKTSTSSVSPLLSAPVLRFSTNSSSSAHTPTASANDAWLADHARTHVPTSPLQRLALLGSSAVISLLNTHRGDAVANVGELLFSEPALQDLRARMLKTEEGAQLLMDKPRVLDAARAYFASKRSNATSSDTSSKTDIITDSSCAAANDNVNGVELTAAGTVVLTPAMELEWLQHLHALPASTFGHAYAEYMLDHSYLPSARAPVRFVACPELAYVLQRHREVHDYLHVLTATAPSVQGELALKALEFAQTGLPSAAASVAAAGALRLPLAEKGELVTRALPWARRVSDGINARYDPRTHARTLLLIELAFVTPKRYDRIMTLMLTSVSLC